MTIQIKESAFASEEYDSLVSLRQQILRTPLGLAFTPEDRVSDEGDIHLGAWEENRAVGSVLLKPMNETTLKLRQMAVAEDWRDHGIGAGLVDAAEEWATINGYTRIEMSARLVAQAFYEKLGYEAEGEQFVEVTIPHVKMWKQLG